MRSDLFLRDYLYELYTCHTFDQRFIVYDKYLKNLGFDGATYSIMPLIQSESVFLHSPVFKNSASFPDNYLDQYTTQKLSRHDFTIKRISKNILNPMDWREHELKNLITRNEVKLIELAREDYGIKNAISIPTMNSEIGMSGASIISLEKDAIFKKLKEENIDKLIFITHRFHESNLQGSQLPPNFVLPFIDHLTANEIGILCHLASGKHFQKIEYSIDIASYKVATNALQNLRKKKFNNITKERLMYLAGILRIQRYLSVCT